MDFLSFFHMYFFQDRFIFELKNFRFFAQKKRINCGKVEFMGILRNQDKYKSALREGYLLPSDLRQHRMNFK